MTRLTQKHQRLSHAAFIHRIVLTAALILLPNLSFAVPDIDRSSEFVVGGMSFFCSNCETKAVGPTGEELCEIEAEGGRLLDSCSHAVTILLRSALTLNSDAKSSRPTIVELQNSLLKPSALVNAEAAGLIVQLLLRTPEGERALTEQLDSIVALHASALIALSETIGQHPQILKAIWGLPSSNDDPLRMQLRLIAASLSADLGLEAILSELGGESTTIELSKLSFWAETLRSSSVSSSANLAKQLTELAAAIANCQMQIANAAKPSFCDVSGTLAPVAARQLERYRLKILMEHADSLAPEVFLLLLSRADLANHRTPETLLAARKALLQLTSNEDVLLPPEVVEGASRDMLRLLAESDLDLANLVAKLLVNFASTQFNLGEFDFGVKLLEESLLVYPSALEIRRSLLEAMLRTAAVRENGRWKAILEDLAARSGQKPRRVWPWGVAVLLILLAALLIKRRLPRADTDSAPTDGSKAPTSDGLNPIERAELRTLLSYFGLPGFADEEALAAEYRQKAKVMHPDAETGEHEEFVKLREKFERAQSLIARR